jgi:hypothetical protein
MREMPDQKGAGTMTELDHWQLFLFLAGLVAAWSVIMLGVQKAMMSSGFKALGEQIEELKKASEKIQGFERQILELKADLPLNYVRKEDFIRHEVVINTKLDRLRDLLEDMKEKKYAG